MNDTNTDFPVALFPECGGGVNLDGESITNLMEFWFRAQSHPIKMGRLIFPSTPKGYATATKNLANYAANKATAMRCRLAGKIEAAICYELICEGIYDRLPKFAKW